MKAFLKIILPVVILAAGIALFVTLKASKKEADVMEAPEKQWTVTTESVEFRDVHPLAHLYGRVESPVHSTLSAALASEVLSVDVREGDLVHRQELLLTLDPKDLELSLRQRESEIHELQARIESEHNRHEADLAALKDEQALQDLAHRNLSRARRLATSQAGSEAGVDDALQVIRTRSLLVVQRQLSIDDYVARLNQLKAAVARAEAARAQVERDLTRTRILAPFDGRVTAVNASVGERVRVGDALLELYDVGKIEVRTQIPERFLSQVRRGFRGHDDINAVFRTDGADHPLRLVRLGGSIRQGQGGLDAFFQFVDTITPDIEIGRVASLAVSLPRLRHVVSIPVAALYGSDTVYRIQDGRLLSVRVDHVGDHLSAQGETRALITSETLTSGDQIITAQIPAAVDGLKVAVSSR